MYESYEYTVNHLGILFRSVPTCLPPRLDREHCTDFEFLISSLYNVLSNICCSGSTNVSTAYQQVWLRGDPDGPTAHVHEGVRLADKSGWVAIGELLPGENQTPEVFKVRERLGRERGNISVNISL